MTKKKKLEPGACADCGAPGVLLADMASPPFWLCLNCAQRRMNSPAAREATLTELERMEAEEELEDHLEDGGKLS